MTRANLDGSRARGVIQDGPQLMNSSNQTLTASVTLGVGAPYLIVLNPGVATYNVTMYTPPVPGIAIKHEVYNSAAATGVLTLKGIAGATIGSVAVGKRAEVIWNPYASPQEWVATLSA